MQRKHENNPHLTTQTTNQTSSNLHDCLSYSGNLKKTQPTKRVHSVLPWLSQKSSNQFSHPPLRFLNFKEFLLLNSAIKTYSAFLAFLCPNFTAQFTTRTYENGSLNWDSQNLHTSRFASRRPNVSIPIPSTATLKGMSSIMNLWAPKSVNVLSLSAADGYVW